MQTIRLSCVKSMKATQLSATPKRLLTRYLLEQPTLACVRTFHSACTGYPCSPRRVRVPIFPDSDRQIVRVTRSKTGTTQQSGDSTTNRRVHLFETKAPTFPASESMPLR